MIIELLGKDHYLLHFSCGELAFKDMIFQDLELVLQLKAIIRHVSAAAILVCGKNIAIKMWLNMKPKWRIKMVDQKKWVKHIFLTR